MISHPRENPRVHVISHRASYKADMNRLSWTLLASVLFVGLFAGVLFAVALAVSPSLQLLDASHYTIVKQAQIRIFQVAMTIISSIYTVLAVVVLVMKRHERGGAVFKLTAVALALIVAALIYSAPTDIAYNQAILAWDPKAPPADWATTRDAWDFANVVRCVPSLIAFVLQSAALVRSR